MYIQKYFSKGVHDHLYKPKQFCNIESFDDYKNERSSGKYRTINFAEDVPHKDIPDTDCRNYILKFQLIKSLCFRNNATIMKHTSAFTKVLRNIYAFPIHQNSYEKSVFHIV